MYNRNLNSAFLALGAAGSIALTLYAGRHNGSWLLGVLFAGWVSIPFVILGVLDRIAARWSPLTRATIYGLAPVIAGGTIASYCYALLHPRPAQPAAPFVATPVVAALVVLVATSLAAVVTRLRR